MSRRLRAFRIQREFISDILSSAIAYDSSNVPRNATVVRFGDEWQTGAAIIIMEHIEFPLVNEGEAVEVVDFQVEYLG